MASTGTASCWRPRLAELVADYLATGAIDNRVFVVETSGALKRQERPLSCRVCYDMVFSLRGACSSLR